MKDKHARTHGFLIHVSPPCHLFADALPKVEFEYRYVTELKDQAVYGGIYQVISEVYPVGEIDPMEVTLKYETPDFDDAIHALFALVEYSLIDTCDANEAAMKFTEAFYGTEDEE